MYDKSIQEVTSPLAEYTPVGLEYPVPPGEYQNEPSPGQPSYVGGRRRRLLHLLAASVVVASVVLTPAWRSTSPIQSTAISPVPALTAVPGSTEAPPAAPTPAPTEAPTMASTSASELMVPEVKAVFYNFSHEHHGSIRMKNTQWLRGVTVTVRETVMEQIVFDHELDSSEISRGFYELPVLSTGDVYMENMEAYDALGAWPTFEMKIAYRYENESEEREESGEISLDPAHETGYWSTSA